MYSPLDYLHRPVELPATRRTQRILQIPSILFNILVNIQVYEILLVSHGRGAGYEGRREIQVAR
jgi:hypothetical protein